MTKTGQVVLDRVRVTETRNVRAETRQELSGKHIVLIIENEAVPFDRRMWNMALSLREFGGDVTVICPKFGKDSETFLVLQGVHVYRYKNTFADGSILGYLREYTTAF